MTDGTNQDGTDPAEMLRETAERFGEDMRAAADSLIEEQKTRMAEMAAGLAKALRRSADAFAEESSGAVASCASQVADHLTDFSDRVRGQSWREVLGSIETAAKRRPELFLAVAVATGFILGRLALTAPGSATEG